MSLIRTFFILGLTTVVLLFAGVFRSVPSPLLTIQYPLTESSTRLVPWEVSEVEMPAPWTHMEPLQLLDQGIAMLSSEQASWIRTSIRQETCVDNSIYRAVGRLVAGPNDQMHLNMRVQFGKVDGTMDIRCDGVHYVERISLGNDVIVSNTSTLPEGSDRGSESTLHLDERTSFLMTKRFHSVVHLLKQIRSGLQNPRLRAVSRNSDTLMEISGDWPASTSIIQSDNNTKVQQPQPEQCRVFISSANCQPVRVEWWGRKSKSWPLELFAVIEYSDMILNQPLTAEQDHQEFHVQSQ